MNTLKKYMLILSAALCCASCSDEDEDAITWAKDAISLSTETIQIAKDGGTTEAITVKSSGDWRLSGACEWAHPSATSGSDGDAVTFVIDKNETDSDRKATFKFFTGGAVAALQIEVLRDYVMVLESEENMIVGEEQTSIAVKLSGSIVEPDVQLTEAAKDWLKLDRISTFNGITIISFAVSANESYKDRSSVINISSPLVDTPIQVNLTQSRTLAIIPDEETIMKDLSASKITFSLRYNVEYELVLSAGSDAWVTNQTISKPVVGEDGLTTVTISYDLLEGTNARAARIDNHWKRYRYKQ